ncbi:MAG: iron uptake porin [Xenococcaceae cyanobacterium MO_167.B27]|nr:iron uptake porin [Xenococcaceae cyanobacterium MO_167.B27]
MSKLLRNLLLVSPAILGLAMSSSVVAQTATDNTQLLNQLNNYSREGNSNSVNQVTNVNQLRDVSPTDWAYEALRSLVDRYGCIAGYPNQTYRGNRALSRYEFAAGLNSCLNQIERLIASSEAVLREDIDTINRLTQEFEAELAALGGRIDSIESRTAFLEDHQFSTTTKLEGEVVFGIAQEFNYDNQVVFQDRVRLSFVSSFTGKDALYTRLDASNAGTFNGIDTGAFTYQTSDSDNDVGIGWLAYYFPIGDKIDVYLPAVFPLWVDFVPSVSPYLDSFTGATGSLSSFGESSPIYKIGLASGGGIGINVNPIDMVTVSAGFFGGDTFNPDDDTDGGLFNEEYSVLGQVTVNLLDDKLQLAATYVNGQFSPNTGDNNIFDLGVGTVNARQPLGEFRKVSVNAYGVAASYQFGTRLAINAFGMYADADAAEGRGSDSEIWSYGLALAFPDLLKEGSLGGVIIGAEPYEGEDDDLPIHVEGFYKYQLNDHISITPGVIWIQAPNGDNDEDDAFIGVVRTTFTF